MLELKFSTFVEDTHLKWVLDYFSSEVCNNRFNLVYNHLDGYEYRLHLHSLSQCNCNLYVSEIIRLANLLDIVPGNIIISCA